MLDLHCHFLPGIDDGAPSVADGVAMLEGLHALGFTKVVATPHMRPALFIGEKQGLTDSLRAISAPRRGPQRCRSWRCRGEHYFDERVYTRLLNGEALPYPSGRAAFARILPDRFFRR